MTRIQEQILYNNYGYPHLRSTVGFFSSEIWQDKTLSTDTEMTENGLAKSVPFLSPVGGIKHGTFTKNKGQILPACGAQTWWPLGMESRDFE